MNTQEVVEGNDVWLVARVLRPDNVVVSQTDLASSDALTVRVYDITKTSLSTGLNGRQVLNKSYASGAAGDYVLLATSSSALLTDGYWNGIDDTGYNFRYRLEVTNDNGGTEGEDWVSLEAGHRYHVEFSISTPNGASGFGDIRWSQQLYVRSLLSV
jgi:hypothetical protein